MYNSNVVLTITRDHHLQLVAQNIVCMDQDLFSVFNG